MLIDKVDDLSPDECKALLKALVAIRKEAECFDFDRHWQEPEHKSDYKQISVASKFGYDAWKFLVDHDAIAYPPAGKQGFLPI